MQDGGTPFTRWVKMNESTVNTLSIILLVFAAWSGIEVLSNVAGGEIPPVTGTETNSDPDDKQRFNNGYIIGLGAIALSLGVTLQLMIPRDFYNNIGDTPDEVVEETSAPESEETPEPEVEEEPVSYDEDLVKLTKWLSARGTTTARFFEWADVDDSGKIDKNELADALRTAEIANLPPWEIEELVKVMDINSDGQINLPELDLMVITIRNSLGIEFIPYDEKESAEEATEEVEEATEEESDEESVEEVVEEVAEEVTEEVEEATEEDSEEETAEEESEEESTEEVAEEATGDVEESTEEESEETTEEESEEESTEEIAEEASDDVEDSEEANEEEVEEETAEEESEAILAAKQLLESTLKTAEETSAVSEEEDVQEKVEEPVAKDETPKKKKKF